MLETPIYVYNCLYLLQNQSTRTMGFMRYTSMCPFGILFQIILFVQITHLFDVFQQVYWLVWTVVFEPRATPEMFFVPFTYYEIMSFMNHSVIPRGSLNFVFFIALPSALSKYLMFGNCHWTCGDCIYQTLARKR